MKNIKTFENWKNNIIDNYLFSSGKAKYNPRVQGGVIKYKTGNSEPYYFARIEKKGNSFICKIYKKTEDGEEIRLRNKIKKDLKTAHNYVREFLNQKLKRDTEPKDEQHTIKKDKIIKDEPERRIEQSIEPYQPPVFIEQPKRKTIIRRF